MSDHDKRSDNQDEDVKPGSGPGVAGLPKNWLTPVVLLLLRDLSSYGYDLMKALATFGFVMLNPGPLYRMLRQMEKEGLVQSSWDTSRQGPARRLYSITKAGEEYLKIWGNSLEQYRTLTDRLLGLYTHWPDREKPS
ncbi:MAG: helix-turn-helix transcriptional regulator [Ktedonobacterales bacterium]